MTSPSPSVSHSSSTSGTSGPAASTGASAAVAAATSSTTIASIAELKQKSPKLWNAMMQSIAQNICIDMQHHSDHLIQMMKQFDEQNEDG